MERWYTDRVPRLAEHGDTSTVVGVIGPFPCNGTEPRRVMGGFAGHCEWVSFPIKVERLLDDAHHESCPFVWFTFLVWMSWVVADRIGAPSITEGK